MRSLKFPHMFNTNNTRVWKSSEHLNATKQNTKLVLNCERGELIGDPYFGLLLRHYMFDQNNYVLRDQIIDMIYTQLAIFIPQIFIERKNINIFQDKEKAKLYCEFTGTNQIDYQINTYQLVLLDDAETSK
jgi:phage baseplate assembly protein W